MAKQQVEKIRVTGLRKHYKLLMGELHRRGILEMADNKDFIEASVDRVDDHFGAFDTARIKFAINFLTPYATPGKKLDTLLSGGMLVMGEEEAQKKLKAFEPQSEKIIERCEKIEELLTRHKNEIKKNAQKSQMLKPFQNFRTPLQSDFSTEKTRTWVGMVKGIKSSDFVALLAGKTNLVDLQVLHEANKKLWVRVSTLHEKAEELQADLNTLQFEPIDFSSDFADFMGELPRDIMRSFQKKEHELEKEMTQARAEATQMAEHVADLKVMYDFHVWHHNKNDAQEGMFQSDHIFSFEAWIPGNALKPFQDWIQKAFVGEVDAERIALQEGETRPALIQNRTGVRSYEAITDMFGAPSKEDLDPTPFVAIFFFVFFGLCLSDVGYGSVLALVSGFCLLFGTFSRAARDGLLLLLFCGIGATIGGVLVGGYFGMTPEQAPSFLLSSHYMATGEGTAFVGQLFNPMEGMGPLLFLGISLALGVVQLLFGLLLDAIKRIKQKDYIGALADPLSWMFFLVMLILFALADPLGLDKKLFTDLSIAGAVLLVITQGRDQKNWLLKPIFGVLGLYNITAYLSDLLSYSRIMALGLATGVIGFAMNLTAGILGGMMPHPALGAVLAVFILIFGHTLNFSLSLLGAFVHSGRLQFIEFFGKFYEGSGRKFKPFGRESSYVFFRDS